MSRRRRNRPRAAGSEGAAAVGRRRGERADHGARVNVDERTWEGFKQTAAGSSVNKLLGELVTRHVHTVQARQAKAGELSDPQLLDALQRLVARMLADQGRSPGGARNILRALSAMAEDAIGELFAVERANLGDGVLRVRGTAWEGRLLETSREKNHRRDVPVPPGLQALLRELAVRIDSPLLFPSPQGKLWRYSNWHRRVWQPTIEKAGLDPTPHEFRHSWVTHLRASGVDPADLADVAGHSVQTATSRYTHPLRRSFDQIRSVVG